MQCSCLNPSTALGPSYSAFNSAPCYYTRERPEDGPRAYSCLPGDLDGRSGSWLCLAQPLSWQPVVKCVGTSDFGTRELRLKQTCRTQSREACQCSFLPMPSSGSTSTHLPEDCASDRCASPEHCPSDRCASPEHTPGGKRHEVSHVSH